MKPAARWMALPGLVAGPWFAFWLGYLAAPLPNFRHSRHPPALLGAIGYPGATAWNVLGFIVTGVLAAMATQMLYRSLRRAGAGATARIGATVMLLSALAFAMQGVFPLDIDQPMDEGPSRIHITVWNLWWMAAAAGALLVGIGVRSLPRWRSLLPVGVLVAAGMAAVLMAPDIGAIGVGWRQRIALAMWFGWLAWSTWLSDGKQAADSNSALNPGARAG